MTKYRIVKQTHGWAVERWQEGGQLISRGRYAGQLTTAKWDNVNPVGYYPSLKWAAKSLLDEEIADGWTGKDLLKVVEEAEVRVLKTLENALTDSNNTVN